MSFSDTNNALIERLTDTNCIERQKMNLDIDQFNASYRKSFTYLYIVQFNINIVLDQFQFDDMRRKIIHQQYHFAITHLTIESYQIFKEYS